MTPTTTVPISAGHLRGSAFWDPHLHTFAATLDVFPGEQRYPPPTVRVGTRCAEFITADALLNHLIGVGLRPDDETLAALDRYGRAIAEAVGETEFVGLTCAASSPARPASRRLFLRTPVGALLQLNPRIDHLDHRLDWGNVGPAVVDTARLLCEIAFVRRPGADVDAFALALTHEFLRSAPDDFSVSASAVCDWYLTDSEPWTTIGEVELAAIRASLGLRARSSGVGS